MARRILLELSSEQLEALAALSRSQDRDSRRQLRRLVQTALEDAGAFELVERDEREGMRAAQL